MLLTNLETHYSTVRVPPSTDATNGRIDHLELITVRVSGNGRVGYGYAYTLGMGGRSIESHINTYLKPCVIGHKLESVEDAWSTMWSRTRYVGGGGISNSAIAAVDIALWDLRGILERQPLFQLHHGAHRAFPTYGSGVDLHLTERELLDEVSEMTTRGHHAVKIKVGRALNEDISRIMAVRNRIGPRIDLMVDANGGWRLEDALARVPALEQARVRWLEEPFPPASRAMYRAFAEQTQIPVAAGENFRSLYEVADFLSTELISVLQIDAIALGGISPAVDAIHMANRTGIRVSSHFTEGLSAHLLCIAQRDSYAEDHASAPALREVIRSDVATHRGYITAPLIHDNGVDLNSCWNIQG